MKNLLLITLFFGGLNVAHAATQSLSFQYYGCYGGYIRLVNVINTTAEFGCQSRRLIAQQGTYQHDPIAPCYNGYWLDARILYNSEESNCQDMARFVRGN